MVAAPEPVGQGPSRARPLEPMAHWFSDYDYPADAIRRGVEGNVRFRLVIDQRGNVESCTVTASSNDAALDAATCSIASIRGRFTPARDRQGHPVKDTVTSRVRWVLPSESPPTLPFEPIRFVSTLHATAEGQVSCSTNSGGSADESISSDCGLFAGSGIAAMMRALRSDTVVTSILTIVPQGAEPPAAGSADYGTSLYEAEAALSVGPDGRIASCRVDRYQAVGTLSPVAARPDVCGIYPAGGQPIFEAAREPGQPRLVRIFMSLHMRGSLPGLPR